MAKAGRPSSRAEARPGASSLFERTQAISAPERRCSRMAAAMARKLEPLPERRMPKRCMNDIVPCFDCSGGRYELRIALFCPSGFERVLRQGFKRDAAMIWAGMLFEAR